ncbi:MAG: hypothetical protein R3283_09015 [Balneolaceae bacterium]|nr:hypothetical protein [Balneolaceae bacterium]
MSCSDNSTGVVDDGDDGGDDGGGGVTDVIEFPITFEENVPWDDFITNFEGGELSVIENPDQSGINTSATVARMVKGEGESFAGSVLLLAENIDFTGGTDFVFSVWAPRPNTTMLFKIENETDATIAFEQEITVAESQQWVDVTFSLAGADQLANFKKLIFIFDLGTVGDGSADFTWYFDNIRQQEGEGGEGDALALPVTFEDASVDYGLTDFGGTSSQIIADPTDGSNNVAATIKSNTAETFAGTTLGGTIGFVDPLPFTSTETTMSVRVWSPTAGTPVRLKVEDAGDPTISVETETLTTVASQWETLVFDFSNEATGTAALNLSSSYNLATIFFNFGTAGSDAGEQTYYWDNVEFGGDSGGGGGGNAIIELPLTFEDDIAWADAITNFEGGDLTVVDNPDQNGNTSAKVARMIKGAGATFAGSIITLTDNIDFTAGTDFTISVWAPRPNTTMLFKIENETDPNLSYEQELTIAESQQWVDITFDMSGANQSNTYKKLVFIFDNGTAGDGSADYTWYFDNINQSTGDGGGGGGNASAPRNPVDFESGGFGADWTWTVFENDTNPALEIVTNPDATGANTSSTVAKFTALQTGNPWAGVESSHGSSDLGPFILDATNSIIRIKVWKSVISDVGIKLVSETGWAQVEIKVANTVVNEWEELVFDFSSYNNPPASEGLLDQVVVFPDFNLDGRTQNNVVYFDDITFSSE